MIALTKFGPLHSGAVEDTILIGTYCVAQILLALGVIRAAVQVSSESAGTRPEPRRRIRRPDRQPGGKEVLHGLTSRVSEGSITGLIGPSGSGKTTLMRTIVGVQLSGGGTMQVLGVPCRESGVAVAYRLREPEPQRLWRSVGCCEPAVFRLDPAAGRPGTRPARCEEALEAVDLTPLADRRVTP